MDKDAECRYPRGAGRYQRPNGSVVEVRRFMLHAFDLDDDGVAALFERAASPDRRG